MKSEIPGIDDLAPEYFLETRMKVKGQTKAIPVIGVPANWFDIRATFNILHSKDKQDNSKFLVRYSIFNVKNLVYGGGQYKGLGDDFEGVKEGFVGCLFIGISMNKKKVYPKAILNWPEDERPREKLLKKGGDYHDRK